MPAGKKGIASFAKSIGGVAAVEFALVLPILVAIAVSLPDLSQAAVGVVEMESAARATVQYAMAGGTDMTAAQSIGLQTWTAKPPSAQLTAQELCLCGSSTGTCGQACSDGTNPQIYISVTTSSRLGGSVIGFNKSITRTVRIQ